MARSARAVAKAAPEAQRVFYPSDGPIEELRGTAWMVPLTVAGKRDWIESQHREAQARAAAAAEQELRQQKVLADRIQAQRQAPPVADDQLLLLQERMAAIEALLAQPDAGRFAEIANGTTQAMGRTFDLQQQVAALTAETESLAELVRSMAEEVNLLREQNLQLLKGWGEIVNGGQEHATALINQYEQRYVQEVERCHELSELIGNNWETVNRALKAEENMQLQVRRVVTELVTEQLEEFRIFLSLALMSIGVNERDIVDTLNRMDEGTQQGMFVLKQSFIGKAVGIAQKYQKARDEAEARTMWASANSAGRLASG